MSYFLDSGPKFTELVSLNAGGIVLDHISDFGHLHSFDPKIFASKFGSCVKSTQILPEVTF